MQTLADQVAIAIDNAHLHAAIKRSMKETQALASINQALNEILDLDRQLQLMVDSISQKINHSLQLSQQLKEDTYNPTEPLAIPKQPLALRIPLRP